MPALLSEAFHGVTGAYASDPWNMNSGPARRMPPPPAPTPMVAPPTPTPAHLPSSNEGFAHDDIANALLFIAVAAFLIFIIDAIVNSRLGR